MPCYDRCNMNVALAALGNEERTEFQELRYTKDLRFGSPHGYGFPLSQKIPTDIWIGDICLKHVLHGHI